LHRLLVRGLAAYRNEIPLLRVQALADPAASRLETANVSWIGAGRHRIAAALCTSALCADGRVRRGRQRRRDRRAHPSASP